MPAKNATAPQLKLVTTGRIVADRWAIALSFAGFQERERISQRQGQRMGL